MFGRDADLERLRDRYGTSRLLTLVGPGGSGKTTLARAFLKELRPVEHAWFVDLTPVVDEGDVGTAVARSMDLSTAGSMSPDSAVTAFVGDREALLVLDNVEQISDFGRWVEPILDKLPRLRVLATSRLPVRARDEVVLEVSGLGLPAGDSPREVEQSAAGALFLARARAVDALEALPDREAAAVAALVRRLDGLPLAIELAAGRSRIMSAASLLAHLDDPTVLARTRRHEGDRHASLAAVLAWSLDLLTEYERRLIRALAIVPDSFDVELAWALAPDGSAVDALDTMIGAGLVSPHSTFAHRFRLLETIRSQVLRELDDEAEDEARRRFAEHMRAQSDALQAPMWRGAGQREAAERFRLDRLNFGAAIEWWIENDPDTGLALFPKLRRFWWLAADAKAPVRQLRSLLDRSDPVNPARPSALATLMMLVDRDEGGAAALQLADAVVAASTTTSDEATLRACFTALGQASSDAGRVREGAEWMLRTREALKDPNEVAQFENSARAWLAVDRGDYASASELFRRAFEASVAVGDEHNRSVHLMALATVQLARGQFIGARDAMEAAHAIGAPATFLADALAIARARCHANAEAWAALVEGWAAAERNVRWDRLRMLEAVAVVLEESGRDEEAATALAIADRERHHSGWARWPQVDVVLERSARNLRKRLGEVAFALIAQRSQGVQLEAFVRSVLASPGPRRRPGSNRRGPMLDDLTAREVEVLALVGAGHTDIEIAAALAISRKTASVHVSNIRAKLGAVSRIELALHARTIGLAANTQSSQPGRTAD